MTWSRIGYAVAASLLNVAAVAAAELSPEVRALVPQAQSEGASAQIYGLALNPEETATFNKSLSAYYGIPFNLAITGGLHMQKAAELAQAARIGEVGIDIFWTDAAVAQTLEQTKTVEPLDWIAAFRLDPSLRWGPHGLRIHDGTQAGVIYNTTLLRPDQAPKSYPAIGENAALKGRIAMARNPEVFAYMAYAIGEEPAKTLAEALMGPRQMRILPTFPDVLNRVSAGEFAIGLGMVAVLLKRRGAPVEDAPVDPLVLTPWGAFLLKGAKHPATGKLFAIWAASPEGQRVLWDVRGISRVTAPDTALARAAVGKKVVTVPYDYAETTMPERTRMFATLMGIR
jgi:iron(III) transport system substrate-binding protein